MQDIIRNLASKAAGDGYVLEQAGDLSESDTMTFKLTGGKTDISLKLRIPDWVPEGKAVVKFGGEVYEYTATDGFIVIPRWLLPGCQCCHWQLLCW